MPNFRQCWFGRGARTRRAVAEGKLEAARASTAKVQQIYDALGGTN